MEVNDYIVDEETTIIQALKQLEKNNKKILFITKSNQLCASITDGDIRRWLLSNGDKSDLVSSIGNYNPTYIRIKDKFRAYKLMNEKSITALPVLDDKNKIDSIVFQDDSEVHTESKMEIPVVIMAGGLGTRLYPYTRILPKPLIPIGDTPIIEMIMDRFHIAGADKFHLIVNHKKNMIKAYLNELDKNYKVDFADEDTPLGTGGGLSLLKGKVKSNFVLSNCDILIEEDYNKIIDFHNKNDNFITMVCAYQTIKIAYGVVETEDNGLLSEMKEKPEFSFLTNTGMYIVDGQVVDDLPEGLNTGFPDIIEKYKAQGKRIGVFPISEESWMDMGQLDELEKMRKRMEIDE